jgi:SpoVK/Ycf46/Vps4 family AAA+-type ATPase
MAIDFKSFRECAPYVLKSAKPILLRGRHGIGKSEVVYQIAQDLELPVVERRASQMTEGDLLGMPSPEMIEVNGEQASVFRPFAWFIRACTEPCVLFFDEVDRAVLEVRQGLFELTDSRKLAGWTLHPETRVISAVNGGEHGDQYQVNEMDPAELDRYTVFDVQPTVEDWLTWAKDNVDTLIWDFINQNRTHLEHAEDFEPNKVYPSRRSWKRFNDCVVDAGLLTEEPTPVLFNLGCGFLGFEAAVAFNDFVQTYDRQVTVEDIVDKGAIEKTEKFDINEHAALVEKMDATDLFKEELTEEQADNAGAYFVTLPSEIAMKLWESVARSENQANIIALHKRTHEYLVSILTA